MLAFAYLLLLLHQSSFMGNHSRKLLYTSLYYPENLFAGCWNFSISVTSRNRLIKTMFACLVEATIPSKLSLADPKYPALC